jgi:hypothetical protein
MDLNALMQQMGQMRETMERDMKRRQDELALAEFTGKAGGGLVEATVNGRLAVKRVRIDRKLMGEDPEMTEDLIAAAVNDALNRAQAASAEGMKNVLGGLNLPPGFKLPF